MARALQRFVRAVVRGIAVRTQAHDRARNHAAESERFGSIRDPSADALIEQDMDVGRSTPEVAGARINARLVGRLS